MNYKVLSIGGSIIIPPTGFDIEFLKKFRNLILSEIKKGQKFVLVVGGGDTCRRYQKALIGVRKINNEELDWMGIYTTHCNAEFVRLMFGDYAYGEVLKQPTKKVKTAKPIIIAGGWKPGWSTDYDAVQLGKMYGAKEVVNLSNVDYVYDKDPRQHSDAKKLSQISWVDFKKIVGDKWLPGANWPFDPIASKIAASAKITVKFVKGTDLNTVKKVLSGKKFNGTVIC